MLILTAEAVQQKFKTIPVELWLVKEPLKFVCSAAICAYLCGIIKDVYFHRMAKWILTS